MASNTRNQPAPEPDTGWKTWIRKKMEAQRGTQADDESEKAGNRIGKGSQRMNGSSMTNKSVPGKGEYHGTGNAGRHRCR
jgi:hypothetical protein